MQNFLLTKIKKKYFRTMANQMNKNLAKELKNFNKDELTETKTSENIVTPVTGI